MPLVQSVPAPQVQVREPVSANPQERGAQVPSVVQSAPLLMPEHCSSVSAVPPVVDEPVVVVDASPVVTAAPVVVVLASVVAVAPPAPVTLPMVVVPAPVVAPPVVEVTAVFVMAPPVVEVVVLVTGPIVVAVPMEVALLVMVVAVWLPAGGLVGSSELQAKVATSAAVLDKTTAETGWARLRGMGTPGNAGGSRAQLGPAFGSKLQVLGSASRRVQEPTTAG